MLTGSEFLILLIITVGLGIFVNPLLLLEGFTSVLKRQRRSYLNKEIEEKILSDHQKSLEKVEQQMQTAVRAELQAMTNRHLQTLAKLEQTIGGDYNQTRQDLENATKKYLADTKTALGGLVAKAAERVDNELNQELTKTRAEINTYREQRLKRIDEEIATLVEKTIYKTLGKGLTLEDHLDIIYEALAEAKEEGFFKTDARKT